MLLLWLFLLPTVRATIECHSACGLCAIDRNPNTAACTLCRECHKVHQRMTGPNNHILNNQQKEELRDTERREFRQVMKEYGWVPEDFVDSDAKLDRLNEDTECIPPGGKCINDEEEEPERYEKKLANTANTHCPNCPKALTKCPPVIPCKKMLVKGKTIKDDSPYLTQSTMPSMISRKLVTMNYESDLDRECPPQPDRSELEDDNEEASYEAPPSTKPTCHKKPVKLVKKQTKQPPTTPTSCVPCMPFCALPCGNQATQSSQFLPSIPQEALEALMTLKPTTLNYNKLMFSKQTIEEKEETFDKKTSKVFEDTKKDYVYLYVGIPKDNKQEHFW